MLCDSSISLSAVSATLSISHQLRQRASVALPDLTSNRIINELNAIHILLSCPPRDLTSMAFRQPQRLQAPRGIASELPDNTTAAPVVAPSSTLGKRPLDDSQEWVLFSPAPAATASHTCTSSTDQTPRSAGLSRLSDFGSLETAARSDLDDDGITGHGSEVTREGEDGEELDSLDDGLHAFREHSEHDSAAMMRLDQSGGPVLPTHDGMGTFPASSAAVQQQIWQFERYNPRPRHLRRKLSVSISLEALEKVEDANHEGERRQRIERWRLDQSRALLDEIERETRRLQRMRRASQATSRPALWQSEDGLRNTVSDEPLAVPESDVVPSGAANDAIALSSLRQFTRRVIRDLIGIDDKLLSVIFGEDLITEATPTTAASLEVRAREQDFMNAISPASYEGQPWEHRLLERIARELGILVNQLSQHPGAFSTYVRPQQAPSYTFTPQPLSAPLDSSVGHNAFNLLPSQLPSLSQTEPRFSPTLPRQRTAPLSEASLWGIEEEPDNNPPREDGVAHNHAEYLQREREYWERDLDVKKVLRYLRNRFSSSSNPPHSPVPVPYETTPARDISLNPAYIPPVHRAALIRHHHPLVTRNAATDHRRREPLHHRNSHLHHHHHHRYSHHHHHQHPTIGIHHILQRRHTGSSSCASQSTRRSKRSAGAGSSGRNYWDIGASSVGSGQPAVGVGAWGEV